MSDENIHAQFFKLGWDAAKEDSKDEIALLSAEISEKDSLITELRSEVERLQNFICEASGVVTGNVIIHRDKEQTFCIHVDGKTGLCIISPNINGYVIIPIERYGETICDTRGNPLGAATRHGIWITNEQIDKAWRYSRCGTLGQVVRPALAFLGIVACPKCGGTNRYIDPHLNYQECECPSCSNNGWIREERGDE